MSDYYLALWLIASALTFSSVVVLFVIVGLVYAIQDERRGGCRGDGCRRSPAVHGRYETRGSEGPDLRVVSTQEART